MVQRAFAEISQGLYNGSTEKYLGRMGDGAAPEIMKVLTSRKATDKDMDTALSLARLAFATPQFIRNPADKSPTNTMELLKYLDAHVGNPAIKAKIKAATTRLKAGQSLARPG